MPVFVKDFGNISPLTHEWVGKGSKRNGRLNRTSCRDVLPPNWANMGLPDYPIHIFGARDIVRKA